MYSKHKSLIYIVLLFILMAMTIVTIKIPGTKNVPFYPFIYLLFFLCIPYKLAYKQPTLKIAAYCWGIIFLWGCLLALRRGFNSHHFDNLLWTVSVFLSCHVLSALMIFKERRYWIYRFFIVVSLLIALSGVYEGLTGIFYHETDAVYLYQKTALGFYRPNTIFYNVNDNAIFATLCLILSSFYPKNPKRLFEYRVVRILSLVLFGANIIMVDSRGAELATVAFLALNFIFYRYKDNARFVLIMSGIIVLPFLSLILRSEFLDDGGRWGIWVMSMRTLASTYFLGVGPGEIAWVNLDQNVFADTYAVHNFILELFCDYGIIGFSALMVWLVYLIRKGYEMFEKEIDFKMLPAIIAFLLSSITCSTLITKGFSLLFFAIIVAEMNRKLLIYQVLVKHGIIHVKVKKKKKKHHIL